MNYNNLIVIIGNGFDLAHGLKTGYNDFAEYYIERVSKEIALIRESDNKESLYLNGQIIYYVIELNKGNYKNITIHDNILNGFITHLSEVLGSANVIEKIKKYLIDNTNVMTLLIKNKFLSSLYNNNYTNWFDIEASYFSELKRLFKLPQGSEKTKRLLKELNLNFEEIKQELKCYLNEIGCLGKDDIIDFFKKHIGGAYKRAYFINFNYTTTLENYLNYDILYGLSSYDYNYIHGKLTNDIIFGYGNDQNPDYYKMKESENNELLGHFKTFQYLNNSNYTDLYRECFDNFDEYEVFVLGHSLGTTDKTLLQEIFNNDKCQQIHLFKRKDLSPDKERVKEDFNNLLYSLSRIITSDGELRKKTKNFDDSDFFPLKYEDNTNG